MDYSFTGIIQMIPETKKHDLIKNYLPTYQQLNKIFKGQVQQLFPGFRTIDSKISTSKMTKVVSTECNCNNRLSALILEKWYQKSSALRDEVKNHMIDLGYNIIEPTFTDDLLHCEPLAENDIKQKGNKRFFYPKGEKITGYDELDTSLMVFLLGWDYSSEDNSPELNKKIEEIATKLKNSSGINLLKIIYEINDLEKLIESNFPP